jgi:hypothetical protein
MEVSMWVLFARAPPPDAPYWPGRRWLAAADAVAWPAATWSVLSQVPGVQGGLVLTFVMALFLVSAPRRLFKALLTNHRYHFTTSQWARVLVWMVVFGSLLKIGLAD